MWAPLSEQYGRRYITIVTFVVFTIWTLACGLAPNWPAFLVFRLLSGAFASAPIAVVTGIFADIYGDPVVRGRGMAAFMAVRYLLPFSLSTVLTLPTPSPLFPLSHPSPTSSHFIPKHH